MPHFTNDTIIDLALDGIKQNCNLMILSNGEPTSYADVTSTQQISSVAMAPADFTLANGDTSGRKVTSSAKSSQAVSQDGDGDHVAFVDTVNSEILHYYEIATARTGLTTADTVNFPAHDLEIRDTVAE